MDTGDRDLFTRRNPKTGLLEVVDCTTGEVVSVQKSRNKLLKPSIENMIRYDRPDGSVVYLEKGVSLDVIEGGSKTDVGFSEVIADELCQFIIEGGTISAAAKDPKFPNFYTISKWREHHPEFDAAIKMAYQHRADVMHDKVLEAAESVTTKDDAVVKRTKIDAYKWSAEKTNPEQYGQKQKVTHDGKAAGPMYIITGVPEPDTKDVTPGLESEKNTGDDMALPESRGDGVIGDTETDV
jgi:hypothetical protein